MAARGQFLSRMARPTAQDPTGCCEGGIIPASDGINAVVAGYWTDLDLGAGGAVYVQQVGVPGQSQWIAQFTDVPHANDGSRLATFQIVLFQGTHQIEIRHLRIESDGGIHTVGIEGAMGHFGLQLDRDGLGHERIAWRMTTLSECVLDADEDSLCDEQDLCPSDSPNDLDADGQCGLGAVVSQEADLVVSGIDAPHATAPFFEATVEVCNQGGVDSLPTTLSAFMYSREFDEGAIGPELDDLTFGTYPVPALAAAACFQQKLYSHGGDGQMYIHVIVDGENRVLEDIESNNTLSVPVLIGHGSDLVVPLVCLEWASLCRL